MRKSLFFTACIFVCSVWAFFIGAYFSRDTNAIAQTPTNVVLSDAEKKFSDNPENVFAILAETRSLLSGTSKTKLELQKARLKLEHATDAFFQKNLDAIALAFYKRWGSDAYSNAFDEHSMFNIKADITLEYANTLKKELLAKSINPKNRDFQAYSYILGKLSEDQKNQWGLDKGTLATLVLAEKWTLKDTKLLLSNTEMESIFEKLGFFPWKVLDLKTMRRMVTSEALSTHTRYTRAYLTAQMIFGRNALGNRIYLRNTLKHEKQIASLSCEANSVAHFYNFFAGIESKPRITEKEAFEFFPVDRKLPELERTAEWFKRRWGDPDKVFVGEVEGVQSININKLTGYGIHAKWVKSAIEPKLLKIGYASRIAEFNEMNIVLSLAKNEPVLFWYVFSNDPKKWFAKLDWKTWEWEDKTGYIGEHTGIIVGVEFTKSGEISKVGYYEWLSETLTWEDWKSLSEKAKYFNTTIIAEKAI